ncbi:hypothetical protein [Allosediminivita pacifica]|uniref:Lipoprotein n=1 Tax=Allosediminivita pacifica TaxID=1267769 RepID=A0A2T6AXE2_9RHOB|nr:hypothetical protein [Allosediminivita pacifica]PTX48469.1 hypothetical protein C8N44_109162 [Allosediminivita pacifica]
MRKEAWLLPALALILALGGCSRVMSGGLDRCQSRASAPLNEIDFAMAVVERRVARDSGLGDDPERLDQMEARREIIVQRTSERLAACRARYG